MKRIVILGQSIAAVKAIEEIRQSDKESEITLISMDGEPPCDHQLFLSLISKEADMKKIAYRPASFYEQNNVKVITDKHVTRAGLKRGKIFTEEKDQIDFDVLLITNSAGSRFPDIKGTNKTGVYSVKNSKDINDILNILPLSEAVVIQSDTVSGLKLALAFVKRGKEVVLLRSHRGIIASIQDNEVNEWLKTALPNAKFQILSNVSIAEILGEGDMRAVRLNNKKVLACEVLILGEVKEDWRFLPDEHVVIQERIVVDKYFKSSLDNVFAVDQAAETSPVEYKIEDIMPAELLEMQGRIVGQKILGNNLDLPKIVMVNGLSVNGCSVIEIGDIRENIGALEYSQSDPNQKAYQKIFVREDVIVGAVLVNSENQKDSFTALVQNQEKFSHQQTVALGSFSPVIAAPLAAAPEVFVSNEEEKQAEDTNEAPSQNEAGSSMV